MKNIKNIRKNSGLSQSAFAIRHKLPLRTLQQWEQGRRNPPAYVLDNIISKEEDMQLIRFYKISQNNNFKVVISVPFFNCEKIYPIQQVRVLNLINIFKSDENIKKIIIFGSSVTNSCHIDSDLDVYIELENNKKISLEKIDYKLDLWNNYTVSKELLDEINDKGVVVYER